MRIEHVALNVADPLKVADWYVENLDMRVVRGLKEAPYTHFLADSEGRGMIEIYHNPAASLPDYPTMHPLTLHIAFAVADMDTTRGRLLASGASAEGDVTHLANGDQLAMLRDPWGVAIQLVRRGQPFG